MNRGSLHTRTSRRIQHSIQMIKMALQARKVSGAFKKRARGDGEHLWCNSLALTCRRWPLQSCHNQHTPLVPPEASDVQRSSLEPCTTYHPQYNEHSITFLQSSIDQNVTSEHTRAFAPKVLLWIFAPSTQYWNYSFSGSGSNWSTLHRYYQEVVFPQYTRCYQLFTDSVYSLLVLTRADFTFTEFLQSYLDLKNTRHFDISEVKPKLCPARAPLPALFIVYMYFLRVVIGPLDRLRTLRLHRLLHFWFYDPQKTEKPLTFTAFNSLHPIKN